VREGVIRCGEGAALEWGRATHSPATPSCHLYGSRSFSMDFTEVGEGAAGVEEEATRVGEEDAGVGEHATVGQGGSHGPVLG
jgi:hypothetical protein